MSDARAYECRLFSAGVEIDRFVDYPQPTFRRRIVRRPSFALFDPREPVDLYRHEHVDTYELQGFEVGADGKTWVRYELRPAR